MLAYTWLGIRDSLHAPNVRWLTYYGLHILTWEFVELLYYWVSHLVDHTSSPLVFKMNLIGQRPFFFGGGGIKNGIFMCIISFDCLNLNHQRVIRVHFFPYHSSSIMFQDPTNKSQHWEKWTQNNPFIGWKIIVIIFPIKIIINIVMGFFHYPCSHVYMSQPKHISLGIHNPLWLNVVFTSKCV